MLKEKEKLKIKTNTDDIKFINDTVIIDVVYDNDIKTVDEVKQTSYIDNVVFWF